MHKIPEEIGSKYRLIVLAGQRVAQLQRGAKPRIKNPDTLKYTTIATREASEGLLTFHPKEQQKPGEAKSAAASA
ncbi:DNA-directed RNA polymerase subunit omega [Sulfidibacter corallicola]|uniref:DNA-directed RNA polymerase subunit omega n=1 Tax=Sulfidibacter corallicola TaxID=2818388 RepID=A0A8A4TXI8_SULCO|nr:DNA-directed RNA polymerase subunit omega [Sulfidibacter corallicola]QTD54047.1 DNA-directed RNA polymerase subunit omega [Sulfidibacter corallicola]